MGDTAHVESSLDLGINDQITLPTKVHLVKDMIFPVVMYGCENWTVKKVEHLRTDAFEFGVGEDSWSPLDCKEIQPVNPKTH